MDVMATRGWGLGVSAAMIVAALVVAFGAPEQPTPEPGLRSTNAGPAINPAAQAPAPATLVLHFRGRGPLARAERARSARRAAAELLRQRAFKGLCFERFSARGVVVRACAGTTLAAWPGRLRQIGAVARVETGAVAGGANAEGEAGE